MTAKEFYALLVEHDWFTHFSDDFEIHQAGVANHSKLCRLARENGFFPLMQAYERHQYSGPYYGTEQAPCPLEPEDDVPVQLVRNT